MFGKEVFGVILNLLFKALEQRWILFSFLLEKLVKRFGFII